ncbi:MAG: nuclear transport factor 2 family protein [Acidimicrobiia bacterium]
MPANDALADELAVRNLLARIAHAADVSTDEELESDYLPLYTDDAVWDLAGTEQVGRAAILAAARARRATGTQGPGTNTKHILTTSAVEVDGDEATHVGCYMMLADTRSQPRIMSTGTYRDTLKRTPDGWKMARRQILPG